MIRNTIIYTSLTNYKIQRKNNSAGSDLELQYNILRNLLLLNYYRNNRKNDRKFTQSTTNSRY